MARNVNIAHRESLKWHESLAVKITTFVGSMLCAALFALLALLMLPTALAGGIPTFIPWVAQTFLQLVLLSIIMVGQNLQQRHAELLAEKDYESDLRSEEMMKGLIDDIEDMKNILIDLEKELID